MLPRFLSCRGVQVQKQVVYPKGVISPSDRLFESQTFSDIAVERGARGVGSELPPGLRYGHHNGRRLAGSLFCGLANNPGIADPGDPICTDLLRRASDAGLSGDIILLILSYQGVKRRLAPRARDFPAGDRGRES